MATPSLPALLQRPDTLPVVPAVAARLIATFGQDEVDLLAVVQEVERDPGLAARLLRQANSSFFRLVRPVHSVREAVQVLGLNRLRALVIAAAVQSRFAAVPGIDLERFWAYSFAAASLARLLCAPRRLDDSVAFTAALLHGVGHLVLHQALPDAMRRLAAASPWYALERPAVEQEHLGYCHADVGAALAQHWRLPAALVQAIGQHVAPLRFEPVQPLAAVVHMAAWRASVWAMGNRREDLIHTYPDEVGEVLGLDPDGLVEPALLDLGEER